jgi:hypothetical protein
MSMLSLDRAATIQIDAAARLGPQIRGLAGTKSLLLQVNVQREVAGLAGLAHAAGARMFAIGLTRL